jgi:hypothetical protein
VSRELQASPYCAYSLFEYLSVIVEIPSIEQRIRELSERAATVDDSEVPALFAELNALLAEHSEAVRYLAAKTLNRLDTHSKTAA